MCHISIKSIQEYLELPRTLLVDSPQDALTCDLIPLVMYTWLCTQQIHPRNMPSKADSCLCMISSILCGHWHAPNMTDIVP